MAAKYPHLRVLNTAGLDRKMSGKKHALNFGINEAKYDILLLTDADCEPSSYDWLSYMVQNLNDNSQKQIVLGVSPYFTQKKTRFVMRTLSPKYSYTIRNSLYCPAIPKFCPLGGALYGRRAKFSLSKNNF